MTSTVYISSGREVLLTNSSYRVRCATEALAPMVDEKHF